MISTDNISKQFGSKPLFQGINITFTMGNKYGLIGANGSGKSTFMKILSSEIDPTSGKVSIDKKFRVATLKQDHFAYEDTPIIDCVIMGHKKLWNIKTERARIYSLESMSAEDSLKIGDLEIEFSDLDGYTCEIDASKLLTGLGIPLKQHEKNMSVLSPGMKLRVLLAQTLFGNPDILLLDEPTNNLDLETINWLENIIIRSNSTIITISHDRQFLNKTCSHIADLDYGEIRLYPGNYDDFMIAATQAREYLLNENKKKQAKIDELKSFVKRFSANASKAKQATSRANQINKIKLDDIGKSSRVYPFIKFNQKKKIYSNVLEVTDLSKSYGSLKVLNKISFIIDEGDRIAILGKNGIGKTTLLNCLVNEDLKDSGNIKWSKNADIAYFEQNIDNNFDKKLTLIKWMSQWIKKDDDEQKARSILGRLLFSKDDINKTIDVLSGGEKRRMMFGKIILQEPNIIIMDEPTNHLDMESIEALNSALYSYEGTIVFASHDREFISSLATRAIEIKPDKILDHNANFIENLHEIKIDK
tara:strand:- start:612 stop:2207 length:1596 start_codon:yes stop_codon:yes gene_type:complete